MSLVRLRINKSLKILSTNHSSLMIGISLEKGRREPSFLVFPFEFKGT